MARTFTAAYDGECGNCGALICAGDEIGYVDDEVCCETCVEQDEP